MNPPRIDDTRAGYGWLSIALHWLAGIAVLMLLFLGSSIPGGSDSGYQPAVRLHTSIAVCVYALLWGRIIFRFIKGHPARSPRQSGTFFALGVLIHFSLLLAMAAMLISGPLMVWAAGGEIHVFNWFALSAPFAPSLDAFRVTHTVHAGAATIILVGTLLHVTAVFKHVVFDRDGTLDRMMIATAAEHAKPRASG